MKRMHIHVGVESIDRSVKFYNALFGAEPVKTKHDYAKWMLDDPRINFAISTRVTQGVDHLGLQVEQDDELLGLRERLKDADMTLFDEGEDTCCYAQSDKSWVKDPSGIAWEAYQTMQDVETFSNAPSESSDTACCVPTMDDSINADHFAAAASANSKSIKTGCC